MAHLRVVVPGSVVLNAAVVPHGYRVRRPAESTLKVYVFHMADQKVERCSTFIGFHPIDPSCESRIHIKRFTARFRMGPDNGVFRLHILVIWCVSVVATMHMR